MQREPLRQHPCAIAATYTAKVNAPVTAAHDRLDALLNAAVDAIVLIDPRGHITRFNRAAESLLGYTAAEVLGENVRLLMPAPYRDEHDGYIHRYLHTGEQRIIGIGREVTACRRDGSTLPINLSVGEFRSGEEHGFVGILRDISALHAATREAEALRERLAHAGRLGLMGEMVSGIAHEVNQPLTAIHNYASACRRLLANGNAKPEALAEVLDKIARQAERAGQVIRGLRGMIRAGDATRETVSINALVEEVSRLVELDLRGMPQRLLLDLAPALSPVRVDGVQIQQVVMNLIRNGLEAMRESKTGETVTVETRSDAAQGVEVVVRDQGPGLTAEVAERLFEPFVTTKTKGMGLGLSICKSIMIAHGGELQHRRAPNGGAEFTLRLPAATDEEEPAP